MRTDCKLCHQSSRKWNKKIIHVTVFIYCIYKRITILIICYPLSKWHFLSLQMYQCWNQNHSNKDKDIINAEQYVVCCYSPQYLSSVPCLQYHQNTEYCSIRLPPGPTAGTSLPQVQSLSVPIFQTTVHPWNHCVTCDPSPTLRSIDAWPDPREPMDCQQHTNNHPMC